MTYQKALSLVGLAEDPRRAPTRRSPQWRKVRADWIDKHPRCEACGNTRRSELEVHHRVPFHLDPSRELDDANLITLCGRGPGVHCHLHYGHAGDWRLFNQNVDESAAAALRMIRAARAGEAGLRLFEPDAGTDNTRARMRGLWHHLVAWVVRWLDGVCEGRADAE